MWRDRGYPPLADAERHHRGRPPDVAAVAQGVPGQRSVGPPVVDHCRRLAVSLAYVAAGPRGHDAALARVVAEPGDDAVDAGRLVASLERVADAAGGEQHADADPVFHVPFVPALAPDADAVLVSRAP